MRKRFLVSVAAIGAALTAPACVDHLPAFRVFSSRFFRICISAAPAALDRYLSALPAMSLIPFAPFSVSAFDVSPLFALRSLRASHRRMFSLTCPPDDAENARCLYFVFAGGQSHRRYHLRRSGICGHSLLDRAPRRPTGPFVSRRNHPRDPGQQDNGARIFRAFESVRTSPSRSSVGGRFPPSPHSTSHRRRPGQ